MFCSGCGTKLREGAKFCFNCGAQCANVVPLVGGLPNRGYVERKSSYAQGDDSASGTKRLVPGELGTRNADQNGRSVLRKIVKVFSFIFWFLIFSVVGAWVFLLFNGVELDSVSKLKNYYVFASRFGYYIPHSEYQVDCIVEEIYFMGNNAELRVRTYKDEELILMVEEGSSESLKVFENGNARLLNLQEHMPLIGKGSHLGVYGDYVGCGERVGRCFSPKRIYILPGSR